MARKKQGVSTVEPYGESYEFGLSVWGKLDEAGLTPIEFRVWAHLVRRSGRKERKDVYGSQSNMATICGISRKSINEALQSLERMGWLRRNRRYREDNGHRTSDLIQLVGVKPTGREPKSLKDTQEIEETVVAKVTRSYSGKGGLRNQKLQLEVNPVKEEVNPIPTGVEVETPESQDPTLQDSLDESVGSHQRIGDSLVKTLGEEPEIEIEMADEEEIFNESPDAKAIRKGAARKSKPKTSSWNTSATKNKSSLKTPTPQGNNSSPHSARPPQPSRAWYASADLASHEMPLAELISEDGFRRIRAANPLEFQHFAEIGVEAARKIVVSALAQLTPTQRGEFGLLAWKLMDQIRASLALAPKQLADHHWTPWHTTTTALGRKQWTRSLVNPITQMNEYQTADYDADSPDGGKPKEQA